MLSALTRFNMLWSGKIGFPIEYLYGVGEIMCFIDEMMRLLWVLHAVLKHKGKPIWVRTSQYEWHFIQAIALLLY